MFADTQKKKARAVAVARHEVLHTPTRMAELHETETQRKGNAHKDSKKTETRAVVRVAQHKGAQTSKAMEVRAVLFMPLTNTERGGWSDKSTGNGRQQQETHTQATSRLF